MELDNSNETIDVSLLAMITECKALRELYVNATVTVAAIEEICNLRAQGKISKQYNTQPPLTTRERETERQRETERDRET